MESGDSDSEYSTLELMCAALGGISFERTGGDSERADGVVALPGGSALEVEVARDVSERFMKSLQEIDGPIRLAPGSGAWEVLLDSRTRLKGLPKKAQGLIDDVTASGRLRSPELPAAFDYSFDNLHVAAIQRIGDSPDEVFFRILEFANPESPYISTSPDVIGRYAEAYIGGAGSARSSQHRVAKFQQLVMRARNNGRKAHFALVAVSPRDAGLWLTLSNLRLGATWDYDLPREDLQLPEGVEGFWVVAPTYLTTVAFLDGRGWLRFTK